MNNDYMNKIKKVIEKKTGIGASEINENSFFEDDLNIDEMELLEILTELEETYQIELVPEQENIATVEDLIDLLGEKID
jgi:acyl carrier protein